MPVFPTNEEVTLEGTAVSPGLAFAPAHIIARGIQAPEIYEISAHHIESEIKRVHCALEKTRQQISKLQKHIEEISDAADGQIFEAHIMLLSDTSLIKKVEKAIRERLQNAEFSFYAIIQNYAEAIRRVNDSTLR